MAKPIVALVKLQVPAGQATPINVVVTRGGDVLDTASVRLFSRVGASGAFTESTPTPSGAPNVYTATLPATPCGQSVQFYVEARSNAGALVSADRKGAAIIAKVEPRADRYRLLEETRSLIARESLGKDSVYLSGSALAQAVLGQATARDLARLIPAVVAVLGVMLFLSFRHPAAAFLSLTEIGMSLVWMAA